MQEIWKNIKDYEELYQVSNFGRVKSLRKGIILKPINNQNYLMVSLSKNSKCKHFSIHRLVITTFTFDSNLTVNHKDLNSLNNNLENLEYVSIRDNTVHHRNSLTKKSKYTGVYWNKEKKKWAAQITINGKKIYLGRFNDEKDASIAYNKALEENNIILKYTIK